MYLISKNLNQTKPNQTQLNFSYILFLRNLLRSFQNLNIKSAREFCVTSHCVFFFGLNYQRAISSFVLGP